MLRKLIVLLPVLTLLTSCDERAEKYATEIRKLLDERSKQLAVKIAAERKAYEQFAANSEQSGRHLISIALMNERNARAENLAADYSEGRKPVSHWKTDLREYAQRDYDRNKLQLAGELDGKARYLSTLTELDVEQAKITVLRDLLSSLAKRRSFGQDLDALSKYGEEAKKEFDKLVCAELKEQKTAKENAKKEADQRLKDLKAQNAAPDTIKAAEDMVKEFDSDVRRLTEQSTNKKCSS